MSITNCEPFDFLKNEIDCVIKTNSLTNDDST